MNNIACGLLTVSKNEARGLEKAVSKSPHILQEKNDQNDENM